MWPRQIDRFVKDLFTCFLTVFARERQLGAGEVVQNDPKTPHVGFKVARLSLHHFGSHKSDRACNFLDRLVFAKFRRHAEITNFYGRLLACILAISCPDKNVEMLDIAMDHTDLVHVIDA